MLETGKDIDPQSREILQTFVSKSGKFLPPTIQTSVKFRDFADPHLCQFPTYNSQT